MVRCKCTIMFLCDMYIQWMVRPTRLVWDVYTLPLSEMCRGIADCEPHIANWHSVRCILWDVWCASYRLWDVYCEIQCDTIVWGVDCVMCILMREPVHSRNRQRPERAGCNCAWRRLVHNHALQQLVKGIAICQLSYHAANCRSITS